MGPPEIAHAATAPTGSTTDATTHGRSTTSNRTTPVSTSSAAPETTPVPGPANTAVTAPASTGTAKLGVSGAIELAGDPGPPRSRSRYPRNDNPCSIATHNADHTRTQIAAFRPTPDPASPTETSPATVKRQPRRTATGEDTYQSERSGDGRRGGAPVEVRSRTARSNTSSTSYSSAATRSLIPADSSSTATSCSSTATRIRRRSSGSSIAPGW